MKITYQKKLKHSSPYLNSFLFVVYIIVNEKPQMKDGPIFSGFGEFFPGWINGIVDY